MAQKINSFSLRLKKRANWNASFCSHNFKDYSNINIKNQQIDQAINTLFTSNFHIFPNNITLTKNSKNYQLYVKLFQKKDILSKSKNNSVEFQNSDRFELLNNNTKIVNTCFLNNKNTIYTFSDFFFNKQTKSFLKITKKQLIVLSPKIIHYYISNQLKKTGILKSSIFTTNLNTGILAFCFTLLKRVKGSITGLKIVCSGKWKKTRSGRKQKLTIKFGQIINPSVATNILYDFSSQKTQFGACSIKVWIAHKKII